MLLATRYLHQGRAGRTEPQQPRLSGRKQSSTVAGDSKSCPLVLVWGDRRKRAGKTNSEHIGHPVHWRSHG